MPSEPRFQPMELDQIHADIRKLMAETMRVSAEASKPSEKSGQCLMMALAVFSGAAGAAVGVAVALLLKLL
jgi:hypothetical protein